MRYDLLILGVVAIAALFFQQWLHIKERASLLDRISNQYETFHDDFFAVLQRQTHMSESYASA